MEQRKYGLRMHKPKLKVTVNVKSKTLHGELRLEHSTSCEHSLTNDLSYFFNRSHTCEHSFHQIMLFDAMSID